MDINSQPLESAFGLFAMGVLGVLHCAADANSFSPDFACGFICQSSRESDRHRDTMETDSSSQKGTHTS